MTVEWAPDTESALFRGVCKFKPAGTNKHWHMINIHLFINSVSARQVSISQCWARLAELYDLNGIEAIEQEATEEAGESPEFNLGWDEFGDLMLEHAQADAPSDDSSDDEQPNQDEDESEPEPEPENEKRPARTRRAVTPDDDIKGRRTSGRLARKPDPKPEVKDTKPKRKTPPPPAAQPKRGRQSQAKKEETPASKRRKRK